MVRRKQAVWAAIAVAALAAAWFVFAPSPEKKVKRRFALLSESVSKTSAGEGLIDTALRLRKTEALFAPTCSVRVAEAWFDGTDRNSVIVAQGFQARMQFSAFKLGFSDMKVSFPEPGLAACDLVARLEGTLSNGQGVNEVREMRWLLRKHDGKWLFETIEVVEALKK